MRSHHREENPAGGQLSICQIKVCGVTRTSDLELLADCGVDSVGFNFVPSSPRCLDWDSARELCRRAAELSLRRVAVVMNPLAGQLSELLSHVEVDVVQLHGVEQPQELASVCGPLPIIKATSWSGRTEEGALVAMWRASTANLVAWLVDAYAPQHGGGTGRQARWDLLQPRPAELGELPLILAGGLNAENVGRAISATKAEGVDTASGVEIQPGIKDPQAVRAFARAAAIALANRPS